MGSEGYLINEFIVAHTNKRTDEWGGAYENRIRFATEIVRRTRERLGREFILIFRLSLLDLVEDGSTFEEVVQLAQAIEAAGATLINSGIGWHEARIPTIATCVPRAGFAWVTQKLKDQVGIPLIATNRINTPEVAEQLLAEGKADMVSMARPFLADPDFVNKAAAGPRRRHQHLHRLQPGLPGPHLRRQDHLLPGQPARLPRDRAGDRADHGPRAPSRWSAPARRAWPSPPPPPSAATRSPVRGRCAHRRPVQHRHADPGQGRVRRDPALLRPPHRADRASR
jgi:hypothetical protein